MERLGMVYLAVIGHLSTVNIVMKVGLGAITENHIVIGPLQHEMESVNVIGLS